MILPEDLRLRLVAGAVVVICWSQIAGGMPALAALGAAMALFLLSGSSVPWRRLLHLEAFLLLLVVTLPFAVEGRPVLAVGGFVASAEGVRLAGVLVCKVTASVLMLTLLLGPAGPMRLAAALLSLGVPVRLVRLLQATARHVDIIGQEARRLQEAMRARAFRPRSSRHTWRSYGYLVGMLLVRALGRADRIEEAMRLRGSSGRGLTGDTVAPGLRDWLRGAGLAGFGLLFLIWDRA